MLAVKKRKDCALEKWGIVLLTVPFVPVGRIRAGVDVVLGRDGGVGVGHVQLHMRIHLGQEDANALPPFDLVLPLLLAELARVL